MPKNLARDYRDVTIEHLAALLRDCRVDRDTYRALLRAALGSLYDWAEKHRQVQARLRDLLAERRDKAHREAA